MGNKVVTFTAEQLDDYQDVTFFTSKEIKRVFRRYRELDRTTVPKIMTGDEAQTVKVNCDLLEKMPELKENPYRRRICQAFSEDGSGDLTFDDFLDMFSVFHEQCPREIKIMHAFKIYDYDCDNFIGREDLEKAVTALTKNQLTPDEITLVCEKVLEESDVDDDGKLSSMEFENVILRSPEFLNTFHIRI
ncbi:hypothetical protein CHUAL_009030 [Chamberlinius hualienensis]